MNYQLKKALPVESCAERLPSKVLLKSFSEGSFAQRFAWRGLSPGKCCFVDDFL